MNIDKTQIPDEVVEAGAKSRHERLMQTFGRFCGVPWEDLDPDTKAEYLARVRDEVAAALSAWPQAHLHPVNEIYEGVLECYVPKGKSAIVLPVQKEGE